VTTATALVLAMAGLVPAKGDAVLIVPGDRGPQRLRLELTTQGAPVDRDWTSFLNRLFDYFDRDGSGFLSAAEAARVIALPLAAGRSVALDFAAADRDRDGKVSRAEFRALYRDRGFGPVVLVNGRAPDEVLAVGEAVFQHLDRDRDGTLSARELQDISALLRRFDEDEDELLTPGELLSPRKSQATLQLAGLKVVAEDAKQPSAANLKLPLHGGQPSLTGDKSFQLSSDGSRLRVPGGVCSIAIESGDPLAGFRSARSFYLAQFNALDRDRDVTKKEIAEDPAAAVLAGLFDAADRDGDGRLTAGELQAFFSLVEAGITCQVVVTATDRGRNLFDLVDTNADGRLDLAELLRAARVLPDLARAKPLARASVPASYRLVVNRGPIGHSFGPVPFGASAKPKPAIALGQTGGPRWFQAMDRNGDGFVSRQEFIGSSRLFSELDADGDGRISVEEAERAERKGIRPAN
jgi:Ca2+-binding EF-hand superfamily protein